MYLRSMRYQGESSKDDVDKQLKNIISLDHLPTIKGYPLEGEFNFQEFIKSFTHMGFQGSNLGQAISLFKKILKKRKDGLQLYLSFTGNMISSGNRELITHLVKNKLIDGMVTTAASIEEDVMKCMKPFHLGSFHVQGEVLLDSQIGRIGNIFVPADRYLYLERFLNEVFPLVLEQQKETKKPLSPREFIALIGNHLPKNQYTKENHEQSFVFWAIKNNIPLYCPAITDGSIGDIITFFKAKHPEFALDITEENQHLTKQLLNAPETACVILGGGVSKHFLLNSAIFREGFEHSIYLTTATYEDGSDSGGNPEEAISWAKLKPKAQRVKVIADATITFPLLVAGSLHS